MVVLPRITQMLPGSLRLNVRFGVGDELIESMTTGQVDMIVSTAAPRRSGIAFEPIFDEELVLVAHPCWTEQAARSIDTIPILAYDATLSIVRRYWRVVFGRRPSRLRRAVVVPDMRVLAGIAARGAGMTVLPKYSPRTASPRATWWCCTSPRLRWSTPCTWPRAARSPTPTLRWRWFARRSSS